tara:strand:- start:93 stop:605 length:513 start_codon:yes stop_codon:yes gene_type:complete
MNITEAADWATEFILDQAHGRSEPFDADSHEYLKRKISPRLRLDFGIDRWSFTRSQAERERSGRHYFNIVWKEVCIRLRARGMMTPATQRGWCPEKCSNHRTINHFFLRFPKQKQDAEYRTQCGQWDLSCSNIDCFWTSNIEDHDEAEIEYIFLGTGVTAYDPLLKEDKE